MRAQDLAVRGYRAVLGGDDDDSLVGGSVADVLRGRGGNDRLEGSLGPDTLTGSTGDDRYAFGGFWGDDTVIEGFGKGNHAIEVLAPFAIEFFVSAS